MKRDKIQSRRNVAGTSQVLYTRRSADGTSVLPLAAAKFSRRRSGGCTVGIAPLRQPSILHAVRNDGVDFLAIVPSPPAIDFPA